MLISMAPRKYILFKRETETKRQRAKQRWRESEITQVKKQLKNSFHKGKLRPEEGKYSPIPSPQMSQEQQCVPSNLIH